VLGRPRDVDVMSGMPMAVDISTYVHLYGVIPRQLAAKGNNGAGSGPVRPSERLRTDRRIGDKKSDPLQFAHGSHWH
jgi:hypothetical protein